MEALTTNDALFPLADQMSDPSHYEHDLPWDSALCIGMLPSSSGQDDEEDVKGYLPQASAAFLQWGDEHPPALIRESYGRGFHWNSTPGQEASADHGTSPGPRSIMAPMHRAINAFVLSQQRLKESCAQLRDALQRAKEVFQHTARVTDLVTQQLPEEKKTLASLWKPELDHLAKIVAEPDQKKPTASAASVSSASSSGPSGIASRSELKARAVATAVVVKLKPLKRAASTPTPTPTVEQLTVAEKPILPPGAKKRRFLR